VIIRWLDPLIRLTGTDPLRVRSLAVGLQREAHGQLQLQHELEGRRGLSPDGGRILVLVLLALASVGLAVAVVALRDRPLLAAMLLVAGQGGAVFLRSAAEVVPLVLGAEDRQVLGWWPVTERELLVARGGLLLLGVLEATAAVGAIPLMALAVVGSPLLAPLAGAVVGLLLHAVTLAAMLLLLVQGLGRLLGRRRARRLVEVMGTVVVIIVINVVMRSLERVIDGVEGLSPWFMLLVPTTWYGSWGALAQPSAPVVVGALAALGATALLLSVGVRILGGLAAGDEEPQTHARRPGRDWTRPLVAWAAPWLGGREGLAMRLLLKAHLREDWRFTGSLMFLPTALLVYLVVVRGDRLEGLAEGLAGIGRTATMLGVWMGMLGLSLGATVTCSTEAPAAWLLHGAVLSPQRALSLERRLVRALVPAPMLILAAAGLVWRGGLDPLLAPLAMAPAWLSFEIMITFVQWILPAAPFSRAWRREGHGFRHLYFLLILLGPLVFAPVVLLYGRSGWGPPVMLAIQAGILGILRLMLRRRAGRLGVYGLAPRGE